MLTLVFTVLAVVALAYYKRRRGADTRAAVRALRLQAGHLHIRQIATRHPVITTDRDLLLCTVQIDEKPRS